MTISGLAGLSATEFMPMHARDLASVAALESSVQDFPWTTKHFQDSLTAGHSCWVMRVDGVVTGFSVAMPVLDETHLLNFAVAPAQHGKGLGSRLLRHVTQTARENGGTALLLEVRPSNLPAIRLYRHFGFSEIGRRRDYYPSLTGREDALVFRKELD